MLLLLLPTSTSYISYVFIVTSYWRCHEWKWKIHAGRYETKRISNGNVQYEFYFFSGWLSFMLAFFLPWSEKLHTHKIMVGINNHHIHVLKVCSRALFFSYCEEIFCKYLFSCQWEFFSCVYIIYIRSEQILLYRHWTSVSSFLPNISYDT